MVRDRLISLLGAGSFLLGMTAGCDSETPNASAGFNVPPSSGTGGDDGDGSITTGADSNGDRPDGGPDDGLDDSPDDGPDGDPDDGPDDGPDDSPQTDGSDSDATDSATSGTDDDAGTTNGGAGTTGGGATTEGGGSGDGGVAGDCCEANGTPSCDAQGCADAVCGADPFCCDTQWDDACVDIAAGMAACECGGGGAEEGGGGADCCEPHEAVGCEVGECEDTICGDDPFCCDDQWDDVCSEAAFLEPSCGCESGETEGGTGDPGDGMLVINEVLYDHPGADVDVFIELAGLPGTSLNGVTLEAVNGNGGAVYETLNLSGTIDASGLFLIVDPAAGATLQGLADEVDGIADLQNGPDSVRLLVDGVEVDALGYGSFAGAEVFAGEGDAAADVNGTQSLSRFGDTDDNATDFLESNATPGAAN